MSPDKDPQVPARVAFTMPPATAREVERILAVTDLGKAPEVFRRAFTLLRIHVDAALAGDTIMLRSKDGKTADRLVLPFNVSAE